MVGEAARFDGRGRSLAARVDFGQPVNQYPAAAALIIGIGNLTLSGGQLTFTGIALGTIAAIVLYHGMRALERFRGEQADPNPLT